MFNKKRKFLWVYTFIKVIKTLQIEPKINIEYLSQNKFYVKQTQKTIRYLDG